MPLNTTQNSARARSHVQPSLANASHTTGEVVTLAPHMAADVDKFMASGIKPSYMTKSSKLLTSAEKQNARVFKKAVKAQTKMNDAYSNLVQQAKARGETVAQVGANQYGISGATDDCTSTKCCCLVGAGILCFPVAIPLACFFGSAFKKPMF